MVIDPQGANVALLESRYPEPALAGIVSDPDSARWRRSRFRLSQLGSEQVRGNPRER